LHSRRAISRRDGQRKSIRWLRFASP